MSTNEDFCWVPGATKKEVVLLKTLNATEIINACSNKTPKVSRYLYYRFVSGKNVRPFVRSKIMQFVHRKSKLLERLAEESCEKKNSF